MKSPGFSSLFFPLVCLCLFLTPASQAATWTVTSTNDDDAGSLRQILAGAGSGDIIVFDNSLSGLTIMLTSGYLVINTSLTIDASALPGGITIITSSASSGLLQISAGNSIVNSLTLTDGGNTYQGGGLVVNGGAGLALYNSSVSGDLSFSTAGGIQNAGTLMLSNCVVSGNSASYYGGGIYNQGALVLDNCVLSNNFANSQGGAIYNSSSLIMTNCVLSSNSSGGANGGALYNDGAATLYGCVISNNAGAEGGGGIENNSGHTATLTGCTVSDNNGGTYGGDGIDTGGTLILNNCTLSGNNGGATYGGGGINAHSCTCILNNCTVSGNIAEGGGGSGIETSAGTLLLTNCTVSANAVTNSAQNAGGIWLTGYTTAYFVNSIIAGNTNANGNNPDIYGTPYSGQNYLVGGNPKLAPLGNYGGPTPTMPPLPGSPVIDAGVDTVTNFLPTDQRGYPRLAGLHVDIGAAEGVYNAAGAGIIMGATRLANGSFQIGFTNYQDMTFTVLSATNMALPFDLWSNLGLAVESPAGSGQFQFTDTNAANSSLRFYHVASP